MAEADTEPKKDEGENEKRIGTYPLIRVRKFPLLTIKCFFEKSFKSKSY